MKSKNKTKKQQSNTTSSMYKELADGNLVSQKVYHLLLDYNDQTNKEFMITSFGKNRLYNLTVNEFNRLHAEYRIWSFNKIRENNQNQAENKTDEYRNPED